MNQFFSTSLAAAMCLVQASAMGAQRPLQSALQDIEQAADESLPLNHAVRERLGVQQVRLSLGETRFELQEAGSRDVVVLIHGYSVPSFVWAQVARRLNAAGLTTLTYDLFGHGLSDRPDTRYTRDLYAVQLKEMLSQVIPGRKAHLVGWSMGAMIAVRHAIEDPGRVASMTMVSPSGLPIRMGVLGRVAMLPVIGDIGHRFIGGHGIRAAQRTFFEDDAALKPFMAEFELQMKFKGHRQAMLSTLREMDMDNFAAEYERYGRLASPTKVLWARADRATPFENSTTFVKLVPGAQLIPLSGVGHASLYERPDLIADEIVAQVQHRREWVKRRGGTR